MSKGILAAILFLHMGMAPPAGRAAAAPSAGDRLLAAERRTRAEELRALVTSIREFDDGLIATGRDNGARHARVNRLIGITGGRTAAAFESTAVLVSLLDELARDPDIAASKLRADLSRARAAALQHLVTRIPETRLPVADDLGAMTALLAEAAGETGEQTPRPPIPDFSGVSFGDAPRLLETPASGSVPVPGSGSVTFHFLPGSRYVLSGDGHDLYVVDLEQDGAAERIAAAAAVPAPTVSASGEYVAVAVGARGGTEVRLLRRLTNAEPRTVLTAARVDTMAFDPRRLTLAVLADGRLELVDAAGGDARRVTDGAAPASSLAWSPDGRHVALLTPGPDGQTVRALVFDALSGSAVLDETFAGYRPRWYADSRSLTALAFSGAADDVELLLERRTVDGPEHDRIPLFRLGAGSSVSGPAWSPDGRRCAVRIDGSPQGFRVDGFAGSLFLHERSVVRTVAFPVPDSVRYDPPAAGLPEFAWHPSGRWCAARQDYREGGGLFLHDTWSGDAIRLGQVTASRPAFSPDGHRALWIERAVSGERFVFRDLNPVTENLPRSRTEAAGGAMALAAGRFEEAVTAFRNAARLEPGDARLLQGLGRAWIGLAFDGRFPAWNAAALETAVRVFARAVERDATSADIRVDFLDASGRLAWIQGKLESRLLVASARDRLATTPPAGEGPRRRHFATIRDDLVEAILWDPDNEYARILLDGVLARYPAGTP